ncbi:MltR family transcriptional regulator [Vibrio hannami]|uniref:MltR family transcriptional regulator n=1 Tax=Vibrio hannami TaxID=2717094 RepID=UPI003BB17257
MDDSIHRQALFLKLDQCSDVASFFAISTSEITKATNELAHNSFASDLFSVPLVGTLLDTDDGPIEETIVKLRILTNLGQISDQDIQDITTIFFFLRNTDTLNIQPSSTMKFYSIPSAK